MRKLAITGITGKNGKYLWEHLQNDENHVMENWMGIKCLVRDITKTSFMDVESGKIPVEFILGDARDKNFIDKLLEDCDTCLHIAGINTSLNVVHSAIKNKVNRLILVHTTGIYSKHKLAGEEYRKIDAEIYDLVQKNNIDLTILRPTMIYGTINDRNVSLFIKLVDRCKIVPTVNGAHYELQPVHCEDLGKAFYQVLMNPEICNGNDYNLSGGEPIELRTMLEEIAKNLGVKRRYISCPFWIAYAGAWGLYVITLKKRDYREKVQRLCEPRTYSHAKAREDFGYSPRAFKEGIVQEVRDFLVSKDKMRING